MYEYESYESPPLSEKNVRDMGSAALNNDVPDVLEQFYKASERLYDSLGDAFSWTQSEVDSFVNFVREENEAGVRHREGIERLHAMHSLANLSRDASNEWYYWYLGHEDLNVRRFSAQDIMKHLPRETSAVTLEQLQLHLLRIVDNLARLVY